MADPFDVVRNTLSNIFGVPASWFNSPVFLINLVVPFILSTVFFHSLLTTKIRIFKRSGFVNWIVALVMAFFIIPLIVLYPYPCIFMPTVGIVLFRGGRITFKRMAVAFFAGAFAWWLAARIAVWLPSLMAF
jgi:hypothetical protein